MKISINLDDEIYNELQKVDGDVKILIENLIKEFLSKKILCKKCNKLKDKKEFYFLDGGLGYIEEQFNICKNCIKNYNQVRKKNKYYDEQIISQFYGAKLLIENVNLKLSEVAKQINNGIKESSNSMGIQNFLYLLGDTKRGLPNCSNQQKYIFEKLSKN